MELCHALEGLECSGCVGGSGWDVSFVRNPTHPSETGHSKATLRLNGENSNALLENAGAMEECFQWQLPLFVKGRFKG